MRTDRMRGDAERLDAESRALLELSVVRGIPDEDLAGVLGIAVDGVRERRERAMRELGAESEADREALAVGLRAGARPDAGPDTETPADSETDPEPEIHADPETVPASEIDPNLEPEPGLGTERNSDQLEAVAEPSLPPFEPEGAPAPATAKRRRLIALAGGAAVALVAGALALGTGGAAVAALVAGALALGGEDADSPPPPRSGPDGAGAPKTGRLDSLGAGDAMGSARIGGPEDRRLLRLAVRDLPPVTDGGYVVWLYDSVSDARPITGSRKAAFSVREPLPPGFARYGFLDISREPADGNPNHSGESVLRVPLEQIPGA